MTTLLFTHSICLEHDTGFGHPECPARLTAVLNTLRTSPFAALEWRDAPAATLEQLSRIHPQDHIEHLLAQVPKQGQYALDGDTILSPRSGEAALRSAGAACAAVDAIIKREAATPFARPGRPVIMRSRNRPWAFACSPMPPSPPPTPAPFTVCSGSR
jgi:acetoin utilization deacetylase AcuC-like enzyme